jgi:hypothetical protein
LLCLPKKKKNEHEDHCLWMLLQTWSYLIWLSLHIKSKMTDLSIYVNHQGVRLSVRSAAFLLHPLIHFDRLFGTPRFQ